MYEIYASILVDKMDIGVEDNKKKDLTKSILTILTPNRHKNTNKAFSHTQRSSAKQTTKMHTISEGSNSLTFANQGPRHHNAPLL